MDKSCQTKEVLIEEAIQQAMKRGVMEVVIREGSALPLHHEKNVTISGSISSINEFIDKRKDEINPKESHVLVNRDKKQIILKINENSEVGTYEIVGQIELSEEYVGLGINSGKIYSPMELSNKLKMMRSSFKTVMDHARIVSTLKSIKAKINKEIEDSNDQKGNKTKHFEQTVDSNMPDVFEMDIRLIKGEEKKTIPINVLLEAVNNDIVCYLESIDAQEFIDEITETRINEEVEKFKDFVVVIEK